MAAEVPTCKISQRQNKKNKNLIFDNEQNSINDQTRFDSWAVWHNFSILVFQKHYDHLMFVSKDIEG